MPERLHILFVSSWYPTEKDPTLGIFNRYFALAAALYNKVTVLNISSQDGLAAQTAVNEKQDNGLRFVQVNYPKVNSSLPLFSGLMKRRRLLRAFDAGYAHINKAAGKIDLIHLNVAMPMGLGVLHLHRRHRIPYVVNENWSGYGMEDGSYKGSALIYFTRRIIAAASAILPTSTYLRDAMQSHGLKGKYEVVPNVVNVKLFRPLDVPKQAGTRFIHISSLNDREKNVSGLIRAFALACAERHDLFLEVVGEGMDRKTYGRLVSELRIGDKVRFAGRLFGEDLVQAINRSDALVMFSYFETFCLVIIEAFACGKPVITSAAGAIRTYMQDFLGYMTGVADEMALSQRMLDFAGKKNTFDATRIRSYAVENYSYEKVGAQLDRIYRFALAGVKK